MKKVLIVTYHYPPSTPVGGVRPSKFARFLPEFGWEPTVLTVRVPGAAQEHVKNQRDGIYFASEWPHPLKVYQRHMEQRARKKGRLEEFSAKMSTPYDEVMSSPRHDMTTLLKRWLLDCMSSPDQELGWLFPAIWRGRRLIREKKITHLITSAPPFTCALVGLALKRLTGVRWVADFRDPWSLNYKFPLLRNRTTDFVESRLIRHVMEQADLVLSVTPTMTEQARKEHAGLAPEKFVTMTNGFDPHDFAGLAESRPTSDPTVFSYLGEFYYGRTPEPFLRALRSLFDDGAVKPGDVRVKFVGSVAFAGGQSVTEMVRSLGLEEIVSVEPLVPRREALQRALAAHVVLVLTEQHSYALTFKLFDALAAGAIIFNIGSGGEVADLLAKTKRGIAVDCSNAAEIRAGILKCIERSRSGEGRGNPEPWNDPSMQAFNFRCLTGELAKILDGLDYNGLRPG